MISARIREILAHRSVLNKIGVPLSCRLVKPGDINLISELVREGYLVYLDRAVVTELHIPCDIYQLTPKGVALCEQEGIPQC